jgi:hypothetical protein
MACNMQFVKIYDKIRKRTVRLVVDSDQTILRDYFVRTFPGASGIIYKDKDVNEYIRFVEDNKENIFRKCVLFFSVPHDTNGNFRWEWDSNMVYDLIYVNGKKKKR